MSVYVALLRGVNVGGANRLPMVDLRRIAEACGFTDVRTYIQSGNAVFSSEADGDGCARALHEGILEGTGVDTAVTVRSGAELERVVAANPFPAAAAVDPKQVHVTFLFSAGADLRPFDAASYLPEEARLIGRELYLHVPTGLGRSRLAVDLGRRKDLVGTTRNWRTVTTLLQMARRVD